MPRITVRDSKTGKVDRIEWNDPTRKPTREEIEKLIAEQGRKMPTPGNIPPDVQAPRPRPNAGRTSFQSRVTTAEKPDVDQAFLDRYAPQRGVFARTIATMQGDEDSYLPPMPGITSALLPKMETDFNAPEASWMSPAQRVKAQTGQWAYNELVQPMSSAIGLASEVAGGKILGAVGKPLAKYVGNPLLNRAASLFGKSVDEVKPPSPKYQTLLPERAESHRPPRFYSSPHATQFDVTRPLSTPDLKARFTGPDPRTVSGQSGIVEPTAGGSKFTRNKKGKFVKRVDEEALPVTIKEGDLPLVDIPPRIHASYPEPLGPTRPALSDITPPGLPDRDYLASMRHAAARDEYIRKTAPPDLVGAGQTSPYPRTRGADFSSEYVGRPDVKPVHSGASPIRRTPTSDVPTSASVRTWTGKGWKEPGEAAAKRTAKKEAVAEVVQEVVKEAKKTKNPRLKKAAAELKGFAGLKSARAQAAEAQRAAIAKQPLNPFTSGGRQRIKAEAEDLLNVPRAIMASVDLSGPRQGIGLAHKSHFWTKAVPKMIRAFGSEEFFKANQRGIEARPNFKLYRENKLAISDMKESSKGLRDREELFMSRFAEKIPGLGRLVRASGRGYVTLLNQVRADTFDKLYAKGLKSGNPIDTKAMARFINTASGRGDLGKWEKYAPLTNALLFSPRLAKARLDTLFNPMYYKSLDKPMRIEAAKSAAMTTGTVFTALKLLEAAGGEVEWDPRSSDFAKAKFGNVRLDVAGGFQQYVRAFAQITSQSIKSLDSGKIEKFGEGKARFKSTASVVGSLAESKLAPIPSGVLTAAKGRTFTGEEPKWVPDPDEMTTLPEIFNELSQNEIVRRLTPMISQDIRDLYEEDPELMWMTIPAFFGGSVQVHKHRPVRGRKQ